MNNTSSPINFNVELQSVLRFSSTNSLSLLIRKHSDIYAALVS